MGKVKKGRQRAGERREKDRKRKGENEGEEETVRRREKIGKENKSARGAEQKKDGIWVERKRSW